MVPAAQGHPFSVCGRLRSLLSFALVAVLFAGLGVGPARAEEYSASYRTEPRPGRVALTFDDKLNPEWTPVILDVLDRYGVKATFFANGFRVDAHPEVAAEVVRRGHSLQNRGFGHAHVLTLGDAGVSREIVRGAESIAGGASPSRAVRLDTPGRPLIMDAHRRLDGNPHPRRRA